MDTAVIQGADLWLAVACGLGLLLVGVGLGNFISHYLKKVSQQRLEEEAEARVRARLGRLLPEAERMGKRLALEPNNGLRVDLGYIHTLHDALDLADVVDSPYFTVCFETNNAWIERRLYENIRRRTGRIGLVQINDFRAGTTCTPSRAPLGDGIIPLERILDSFEGAGYDGYYDIGLVGPEIEEMGYEQAVARSLEFLRRLSVG